MITKILSLRFVQKYQSQLLLMITITPFLLSFLLERIMLLIPCSLCITERWLHFAIFLTSMVLIKKPSKTIFTIQIFIVTASLFLTIYHAGVESNIFASDCQNITINFLKSINTDCSIPKFFLGIKLTFWNILYLMFEYFAFFLYYRLTIKK